MPSDAATAAPAGRLAWLRSQGLGVVCGQLTVVLLGVGSVILAKTGEGASAGIHFDDITAFFAPVAWVHWWFYALLAVLTLYALNTVLCTWTSVRLRLTHKVGDPTAWAATFMHVAFLVALLAHLVGGVWTTDLAPVLVAGEWTPLGDGRQARVTGLEQTFTAAGRPKEVQATVEVQDAAGAVSTRIVGYNEPLSDGLGSSIWLLEQAGTIDGAMTFSSGPYRCVTQRGIPCLLGTAQLGVLNVTESPGAKRVMVATVRLRTTAGARLAAIAEGGSTTLPGGGVVRFEKMNVSHAVQLRGRSAPGNPLLLLAALLMSTGLVLMGRRWL